MPAPKGNQFALGNNGGQPMAFDSPEQLETLINEYFDKIDAKKHQQLVSITKNGDEIYKTKEWPYTVEGLCLHLDINYQTLVNYRKKRGYEVFFGVITRAMLRIRDRYVALGLLGDYEQRLVQFILTNMASSDYKNKVEETKKGGFDVRHKIIVDTEEQAKKIDDFFTKE